MTPLSLPNHLPTHKPKHLVSTRPTASIKAYIPITNPHQTPRQHTHPQSPIIPKPPHHQCSNTNHNPRRGEHARHTIYKRLIGGGDGDGEAELVEDAAGVEGAVDVVEGDEGAERCGGIGEVVGWDWGGGHVGDWLLLGRIEIRL